jgi:hypothetical protein
MGARAIDVAIVGAGPAGFALAAALLADASFDVHIDLIDRAARPDGMLRHGPASGVERLKKVARQVDAILGDPRVRYFGNVYVGDTLKLNELRLRVHAVVLATGAPLDLPLDIAGNDSVGVGTVTHVEAWLAGSADVDAEELDLAMDTVLLIGVSRAGWNVAETLSGRTPPGLPTQIIDRLANSSLRHVQLVDPRPRDEVELPGEIPPKVVVRTGLTPVGIVGRNRARAVRCVHPRDPYGRVVTEDLRAQLLLRPRTTTFAWPELDECDGHVDHDGGRALSAGAVVPGVYVAGWAGRSAVDAGSHSEDAAAVVAALRADIASFVDPAHGLSELAASPLDGWSAVSATDVLIDRFAGEGKSPLADYDALYEQVDED